MINEIKEILDLFYNEYPKEEKILEKYITILQEGNERLGKLFYVRDEENIKLKKNINKANQLIEKQKKKMYKSRNKIAMYILMNLENILRGDE